MTSNPTDFKTHNTTTFAIQVERMVERGEVDGYIEGVSALLEQMDLDPEESTHLISKTLVGKMFAEAGQRRLLKSNHVSVDLTKFTAK